MSGQKPRGEKASGTKAQRGGNSRGAIIRTAAGSLKLDKPGGQDAGPAATRVITLVHELASLLDGALRHVGLMLRSAQECGDHVGEQEEMDRRLGSLKTALEQMAAMVTAAGRETAAGVTGGATSGLETWGRAAPGMGSGGAGGAGGSGGLMLSEAIVHAATMLEPAASEHGVTIDIDVAERFASIVAGAMYSVVINGIKNAIEAIGATGRGYGRVSVRGRVVRQEGVEWAVLEIGDDGVGPPGGGEGQETDVFAFGVTTKRGEGTGGMGVGLAICRDIVVELGGTIRLARREAEPGSLGTMGVGAVLRVSYPLGSAGAGGIANA